MKPLSPERVALLKAADILEREGWCQGEFLSWKGERCAQEAIGVHFDDEVDGSYDEALKLLANYAGLDVTDIPEWNDNPDRTKDEVVSALRAAAVHGL